MHKQFSFGKFWLIAQIQRREEEVIRQYWHLPHPGQPQCHMDAFKWIDEQKANRKKQVDCFLLYAFEVMLVGEADVWFFGSGHRRQFPIFLLFSLINVSEEAKTVPFCWWTEEELSADKMARMTVTACGDLLFLFLASILQEFRNKKMVSKAKRCAFFLLMAQEHFH